MDWENLGTELKKHGFLGKALGGIWDYLLAEQEKYDKARENLERRGFDDWDIQRLYQEKTKVWNDYERRLITKRINALLPHDDDDE